MSWYLLVYAPGQRAFVREIDRDVMVGRDRSSDVVLPFGAVSRRQCELIPRDGRLFLRDMQSASGTYVNLARIPGEAELKVGDRIASGDARMVVDDRYPDAWVSHELLEWSAPVGARFAAGDFGMGVDFPMPKDRMQQGRAFVAIRREDDEFRLVAGEDFSIASEHLRDGDPIRIGDRGVLRFHRGSPPVEPQRSFFRDSGLAALAQMLVSPDPAYRAQATELLRALGSTTDTQKLLDYVRISQPLGRAMSHLQRPPRIQVHDEHLAGPTRSAFEHLALHALAQSERESHRALRESVGALWIGFVAPPPWWERESLLLDDVRLDVDLEPLLAFPNLRELVVENAARVIGPALPSVRAVRFLGCKGLGDYRARFPSVARWDAHQPQGFRSSEER